MRAWSNDKPGSQVMRISSPAQRWRGSSLRTQEDRARICSPLTTASLEESLLWRNIKLHSTLKTSFLEHNKTCNEKVKGKATPCLNRMKYPVFWNRKKSVNQRGANVYWGGQVMPMSQLENLNSKLWEGSIWLHQPGCQVYPGVSIGS